MNPSPNPNFFLPRTLPYFFYIQIKAAFQLLPKLFLILCFCLLFTFGILTAGKKALEQPDAIQLPVALVLPEDDTYAGIAFTFLEQMDSIRSTCTFIRTNQEEALDLLQSGRVYAAILIPDSFIENILNGTNSSATLILPQQNSLESILFVTLADSGTSILSTAQAGIYAMEDVLLSYQKWDALSTAEEKLNQIYLSYAFNRSRMFQTESVSSTDRLSLRDYYTCSGIVLCLLLSGLVNYHYFRAESADLRRLLNRQGMLTSTCLILKLLAVSFIYTLFLFPFLFFWKNLPFSAVGNFFVLTLAIQIFLMGISFFCPHAGTYYIVSSAVSVICLFLSGAFLPSVFLPETIRRIGELLPTSLFLRICRGMLGADIL